MNNEPTKNILNQLKDFELAFLFKYKKSTYLPATQNNIIEELKQRGMTEKEIDIIIQDKLKTKNDSYKICPRCKSDKTLTQKVFWSDSLFEDKLSEATVVPSDLSNKAEYPNRITCHICGYCGLFPFISKKRALFNKIMDSILGLFG